MLQGKMIDELIETVERAEEHAQKNAEVCAAAAHEPHHCPTPMYETPRVEVLLGVA
jgi:hypothetical protein